jgi:hypothetical protein
VALVETAGNSRGVDENSYDCKKTCIEEGKSWKDILSTGVVASFGLAHAWISVGRLSVILEDIE